MKRTSPLKRTGSLERRSPVRAVSPKRRKQQKKRWELAADYLGAPCRLATPVCTGAAEHWHEIVGAGRGGSRTDRRNITPACDRCNSWVEDNPNAAYMAGMKMPVWEAKPGDGGLVPDPDNSLAIAWDEVRRD